MPSGTPYSEVALRAIIESSLITWIGLLMYEITSVAPAGRITVMSNPLHLALVLICCSQTDLDVGYVMGCILPVFFVRSHILSATRSADRREALLSYYYRDCRSASSPCVLRIPTPDPSQTYPQAACLP